MLLQLNILLNIQVMKICLCAIAFKYFFIHTSNENKLCVISNLLLFICCALLPLLSTLGDITQFVVKSFKILWIQKILQNVNFEVLCKKF